MLYNIGITFCFIRLFFTLFELLLHKNWGDIWILMQYFNKVYAKGDD